MTNNTQFKTLLNTWLNQKKPMITPSTHASFSANLQQKVKCMNLLNDLL